MKAVDEAFPRILKKTPLDFLVSIFHDRKKKNSSYSMRAFARDLGISTSFLSRVFSGTRPLSLKLALRIGAVLELSASETNALVLSVLQNSSKDSKISKKIRIRLEQEFANTSVDLSRPQYTSIDVEQFKAMANWYHLAILNLTTVEGFKSDPTWIAGRLGINSIDVRSAIDRLISLGLLVEAGATLSRTKTSLHFRTEKSHLAIRQFHREMISKALVVLEKADDEQFQRRLINGITFSCDSKHVDIIKKKIDIFQDEILTLAAKSKKRDVYQMNVQFFPITEMRTGDSK